MILQGGILLPTSSSSPLLHFNCSEFPISSRERECGMAAAALSGWTSAIISRLRADLPVSSLVRSVWLSY